MSAISFFSTAHRGHSRSLAGRSVQETLKHWWTAFWLRRAQRATVAMLRSLDDRSLNDIGISRSEIESVVYAKQNERRVQYAGGCW